MDRPKVRRTTWRERAIFNTRRKPFPYLFHPWTIEGEMGFIMSGSKRAVRRWMREWDKGE